MANPLFQILNQETKIQGSSISPQLMQLKQLFKSGGNPMSLIPPQLQFMLGNNGNYQQLFYQMCQQKGVNPQEIIDFLKN